MWGEATTITGTALISSRPDQADVSIDGKRVGEKTTAQLKLTPGYHLIRVEKAGSGVAEQSVVIEADQINIFEFPLHAGDPVRGTLEVKTTPPGAAIVINGRDPRGASPSELELPPGIYGVRLSLDGYQTAEREVTIAPEKSQAVEITLQREN